MYTPIFLALLVVFSSSSVSSRSLTSSDLKVLERFWQDDSPKQPLPAANDDKIDIFSDIEEIMGEQNDDRCYDKDKTNCETWANKGRCDLAFTKARMEEICPMSCGKCKAPAAPACSLSEYGCCWNGVNEATGPNQEGCLTCKNYKTTRFCENNKSTCDDLSSEEFMKNYCAETCGYCSAFA
uniref:Toxin candidate TRINITY_DN40232_c1_g10_i3 n=1 Tax=Pachycerianthus maua TaxID=2736681 RepID=A0A7G7WZ45_9CNID|nr:toxin candidate TRINITY_DN40232_c1_g10_i3 [Pachycerianthus maua]